MTTHRVRTRRAAWSVGLLAIASTTVAFVPSARSTDVHARLVPGTVFDTDISTNIEPAMPNGMGASHITTHGMATADGAMRMEIMTVEGANGVFAKGDYFLVIDGKFVLVHPASKTYVDVVDQAMSGLANLPPEIASQLVIQDVKGTSEKVAGSEPIDGRPTEHYKSTMSYSMSIMGQTIPSTVSGDTWTAKLPMKFMNPFAGNTSAVASGPMAPIMSKTKELMAAMGDGVPIKQVQVTTVSVGGQTLTTTVKSEMTNIKSADIDATQLALPAGYTKAEK